MANKNETECGCMGIYNSSTNSCDDIPVGVDACPENGGGFWNTIGGWDWKAISENSLQWGYALGFLKPPNAASMENQQYMAELQRQKNTMNMILLGLAILMIVLVIVVVRRKK